MIPHHKLYLYIIAKHSFKWKDNSTNKELGYQTLSPPPNNIKKKKKKKYHALSAGHYPLVGLLKNHKRNAYKKYG